MDIEELAPHVRKARHLSDGAGADEPFEASVAIGMHPARKAGQMRLGVMGLAVGGEPVPGRRRPISGPGTLVANVRPGACRRSLARSRGKHLDRRVIDEDCLAGEHVASHCIGQRLEQRCRLAHPAGQR